MASQRLENKVAVITGSSSGLGRAIALAYSKEGAVVVCSDLQPAARDNDPSSDSAVPTHELITKNGGKAIFVEVNVTDSSQVKNLIGKAVEAFGRVDIMVNNAGIGAMPRLMRTHEFDEELFEKLVAVNVRGVFLGCKYAAGQMLEQEPHASGHRGWIVNLASIASLVGFRGSPAYAATKGAVNSLTRAVAMDYAADKIHCNALCPGFTETGMVMEAMHTVDDWKARLGPLHPLGGIGRPEDVAKAAVFLASEDVDWITGVNLPVDGGYTAQ